MKFKGEPNLFVRINIKAHQRMSGRKGFLFDENGFFETENQFLIGLLDRQYERVEEPKEEIKLKKCKKCDFTCDNQGDLLSHYREIHPKKEV
jgi:hypothetical protein